MRDGFTFEHFLLSVTGDFTPQPYIDGDIVMLFNGEIYNQDFSKSDGEVIIPLYKKYGIDFAQHLDGEFAIAVYDFKKGRVTFATDPFASKPLWINGTLCASYKSGVGGEKQKANLIISKDLKTGEILEASTTHYFDFNNQHKTDYHDWITAFKRAVAKRAKKDCFLGLSSGYDSGAIACELNNLGIDYKAYTIPGKENLEVIRDRLELVKDFEIVETNREELQRELNEVAEDFKYRIKVNGTIGAGTPSIHTDKASLGLVAISKLAHAEGRIVYLSGQGADEIMSDYSPFRGQSELRGTYPVDLKPWFNFYDGCQYSYLGKEEYVPGAYNIESRYPFLDKQVVQEFLWLTPELKNKMYKAPLTEYLRREKFPFKEGEKLGFNI